MTTSKEPSNIRLRDYVRDTVFRARGIGRHISIFDDFYHFVLSRSWPQFFGLVFIAYFVINTVFAIVYLLAPGALSNVRTGSFTDAFFFSVQTFATIGYGVMAPVTVLGHILVSIEAVAGTITAALITGVTFARFARPTAQVLFSRVAVIHPRNGVPHLMFRMANWRLNQIIEARLSVTLLVDERTQEGDFMRRPYPLQLSRDTTPLFTMSWTAMHAITEQSPFYGPNAFAQLREKNALILLTLRGTDETFSSDVTARHVYELEDVIPDSHFADVLTAQPDGSRVVDFRRFHMIEPDAPAESQPSKLT